MCSHELRLPQLPAQTLAGHAPAVAGLVWWSTAQIAARDPRVRSQSAGARAIHVDKHDLANAEGARESATCKPPHITGRSRLPGPRIATPLTQWQYQLLSISTPTRASAGDQPPSLFAQNVAGPPPELFANLRAGTVSVLLARIRCKVNARFKPSWLLVNFGPDEVR